MKSIYFFLSIVGFYSFVHCSQGSQHSQESQEVVFYDDPKEDLFYLLESRPKHAIKDTLKPEDVAVLKQQEYLDAIYQTAFEHINLLYMLWRADPEKNGQLTFLQSANMIIFTYIFQRDNLIDIQKSICNKFNKPNAFLFSLDYDHGFLMKDYPVVCTWVMTHDCTQGLIDELIERLDMQWYKQYRIQDQSEEVHWYKYFLMILEKNDYTVHKDDKYKFFYLYTMIGKLDDFYQVKLLDKLHEKISLCDKPLVDYYFSSLDKTIFADLYTDQGRLVQYQDVLIKIVTLWLEKRTENSLQHIIQLCGYLYPSLYPLDNQEKVSTIFDSILSVVDIDWLRENNAPVIVYYHFYKEQNEKNSIGRAWKDYYQHGGAFRLEDHMFTEVLTQKENHEKNKQLQKQIDDIKNDNKETNERLQALENNINTYFWYGTSSFVVILLLFGYVMFQNSTTIHH